MGNRAVITFDKKPTLESIGIYLHWNGGPESVLAFLEAANKFAVRDGNDQPYQLARVIQLIGNFFGGTTSLGVDKLKNLDCSNGNNGVYSVSRNNGKITIRQSPDGKRGWKTLDVSEIKKHEYWKNDKILNEVLKPNTKIFSEA